MSSSAAAVPSSSVPPDQRLCSEASLDALCNELTAYYFERQTEVPAGEAVDAIGKRLIFQFRCKEKPSTSSSLFFFFLSCSTTFLRIYKKKKTHLISLGYRIGRALAERLSLKREGTRHQTQLDAVKHACKEIWSAAFGKQVDALRTNHRGTFVLRDAAFRRLASLSREEKSGSSGDGGGGASNNKESDRALAATAATALRLHAGVVRGALSALGIEAEVTAVASPVPPAAEFTVVVKSE